MRGLFSNLRYKLLALGLAIFLWVVAHGSSPIERGFDVPVVLRAIPENLVVTDQSTNEINVRVRGSRAALRTLSPENLEYVIDVSGAKAGVSEYEVDVSRLDLPRGAEPVSRSPSGIELVFEPRGTRTVRVRPDVTGEPAEGFRVGEVVVQPSRVEITGARSQVLRLSEVVTETVDVSGAKAPIEREVRISLGEGRHVWVKDQKPVRVHVQVESTQTAEPDASPAESGPRSG